eukprot:jgi/Psemu1/198970/e_gw1.228.36.1
MRSKIVQDSVGSHSRYSGVLLLSLLQQQQGGVDLDDPGSAVENRWSQQQLLSSSPVVSTTLTTANGNNDSDQTAGSPRIGQQQLQQLESDKVERVLDANTILLQKKGMVRLAGVRMPSVSSGGTNSNFQFPTCFTYSPSYKVRQLLPKKTPVRIQTLAAGSNSNNNIPQVVLVRTEDSLVVNEELVKTGFAVVKTGFAKQQQQQQQQLASVSSGPIIDAESLQALQDEARSKGLGIFSRCDGGVDTVTGDPNAPSTSSFVADFEPLERSVETVYLSDGGKRRVRDDSSTVTFSKDNPPKNPGDVRGCSDFESYEEALQWYETYQPYYGDVAKLDRDGDGVPCPGLPHTTIREKYRMKVPTSSVGMK